MDDSNIPVTKTCTKCRADKPATLEFFSRHRDCAGGLRPYCKACAKLDYRARANAEGRKPWPAIASRFWSRVDRRGPDECWEWRGCWRGGERGGKRYGGFSIGPRDHYAQRVAYSLANAIPLEELDGIQILHQCDNPPCCNPKHLFEGTNQDNVNDKVNKGRQARCPGEKNGNAILTERDVLAIRKRYAAGGISQRALAREYGVTRVAIRFAINRRTWRHVA